MTARNPQRAMVERHGLVPVYLDRPGREWSALDPSAVGAAKDVVVDARCLIQAAAGGRLAWRFGASLLYHGIYKYWGNYKEECDALADALGERRDEVAVMQRLYSLGHACTTVAFRGAGDQMHLMRSLDWPMMSIGPATRIFSYQTRDGEVFKAVGIAGVIGTLTVTKPGIAAAINFLAGPGVWALADDPLLRLRKVMESESTFDGVVRALCAKPVASPVAYTVCGSGPREACVIEIGLFPVKDPLEDDTMGYRPEQWLKDAAYVIRWIDDGGILVQGNHYHATTTGWQQRNKPQFPWPEPGRDWYSSGKDQSPLQQTSLVRETMLAQQIRVGRTDLADLPSMYSTPPIWNEETVQWVAIRPSDGVMKVWSCAP